MDKIKTLRKIRKADVGWNRDNMQPDDREGCAGKGFDKTLPIEALIKIAYKMNPRPNIIIMTVAKRAPYKGQSYMKLFPLDNIDKEIEKRRNNCFGCDRCIMYIIEWEEEDIAVLRPVPAAAPIIVLEDDIEYGFGAKTNDDYYHYDMIELVSNKKSIKYFKNKKKEIGDYFVDLFNDEFNDTRFDESTPESILKRVWKNIPEEEIYHGQKLFIKNFLNEDGHKKFRTNLNENVLCRILDQTIITKIHKLKKTDGYIKYLLEGCAPAAAQ